MHQFVSVFSVCICTLFVVAVGFADDTPARSTTEWKTWVAQRIEELDADTLSERSTAEEAFLKAGPEVLPFLPAPELLPSVSVRQAMRRIRLQLEAKKARDSVKPSLVTLNEAAPLEAILKKITEQTGNPIDASLLLKVLREKRVSINVERVVFWRVLELLSERAGFHWESSTEIGKSHLVLKPADSRHPEAAVEVVGAFRVAADSPGLRPLFGDDSRQLLRVPFRLSAEPRLRPLFLRLEGKDFTARTKDGKTLAPFNPDAKLELPLGEGGSEASFRMDFLVPKPFAIAEVKLTGEATLTVAAGSEDIAFTNLPQANGVSRRRGGVTVSLSEISFQPDKKNANRQSARFRVTVHYDTGGPAFESHRTWIFHNQVYLEDGKGNRVERNAKFHTDLQTDGGVIVEYNFENLAESADDYKFVYVAPTLIINVPIAFEFENLPVPKTP